MNRSALPFAVLLAFALVPRRAEAWGLAAPVGPTGCSSSAEAESERNFLLSASVASFRSELAFDDADYTLRQTSYVLGFGRRLSDRASVVLAGGLIGGGELEGEGRKYRVGAGWLASVGGGYRLLGGADGELFGVGTLSMGFSRTHVEHEPSGEDEALSASDLRLGLELGVTLFERLRPFALARVFSGPVAFRRAGEERVGGDRHHYALGFGAAASAGRGLDVRFESSLLGERAFVWSAALGF